MLIQSQNHSLKPLTTAHLAQTMSLLELTWAELRQKIENEISSNPALEVVDIKKCPNCHRIQTSNKLCPICSYSNHSSPDQPIVFLSARTDFQSPSGKLDQDHEISEEFFPEHDDLPTYVFRQISPELKPKDRSIAAHILTSLNEDGLLETPLIEIAQYHHLPTSRIKDVLRLIQHADPVGVGSMTPQEALLIQLEILSETRDVPAHTALIIKDNIDLLGKHAYHEISKKYNLTIKQVKNISRFISDNLNPFPGRSAWGNSSGQTNNPTYIFPDIIINLLPNDHSEATLIVEILSPYAGRLKINPLFRSAIMKGQMDENNQWRSDYESAILLVKCLQQRNQALVRLMQQLVVFQREFILHGDGSIIPLTRAHLAETLDVHESTISRAVSDKKVQLPNNRIIPLSRFFDRSLHIRTALKNLIDEETDPLTDNQLADLLREQGFDLARRTITKYRTIEGILPARLRQSSVEDK